MTDKKLTDNEIIKALECRILTGLRKINKCGKCKYVKSDACNIRGLITDALDLINRQNEQLKANFDSRQTNECENIDVARFEAEINRLQEEKEALINGQETLQKHIADLQAENEELQELMVKYNGDIAKQEAEIERLEKQLETLCIALKLAKAEAYKEFAEKAIDRVEKAKAKYQRLCKEQGEEMEEHMHIHFNGIIGIIRNLLKEMVGEDNARKT